jgi:DnaJ family protein C protein 2
LSSSSSEEEEEILSADEEDDTNLLGTLDPKEWKNQDHYAVLGLAKLRYKATEDQIKRAYKKKVLRHHPDKKRARGVAVKQGEEDYFTCITRAYEILGSTVKRRSYDSVDPQFDDTVPSMSTESRQNFYQVFGPVFEQNSRWSVKQPVPQLGDDNTSFEDVNKFYAFWYNVDSWREYSYLDEEEKEKGENRDERRWIEKQNKAARLKLKKEETARIRQLVDNAYACDPRIARFKQEEKDRKLAEKRAKQDAVKQKAEEEQKIRQKALEEERLKKEKLEEEAKAVAAAAKKEKEAQKKVLKKERKTLRTVMKDFDYLASSDTERVQHMQEVDKLAELLSVTSLQTLNEVLTTASKEQAQEAFLSQVAQLNEQLENEKRQQLEMSQRTSQSSSSAAGDRDKDNWSESEVQMLIKAVNLFPAGTNARWETIANFLKLHVPTSNRSAKDVLAKAKQLQKNDSMLKEEANKKAFEKFTKEAHTGASIDTVEVSERYETAAETQVYEVGSNPAPWTADEQKLLEQAMRTFPASEPDRWDKIADCIPCRTKKDCMKRYKELVELVRTKKLAQAAATAKKK